MATARELLNTNTDYSDAILCGFDRCTVDYADGGFSIRFDGGEFPTVTLNSADGEVQIVGYAAIRQAALAFDTALRLARAGEVRGAAA